MAKRKTPVAVNLDEYQLALVDMSREGTKCRTGKMPTRASAIVGFILQASRGWKPEQRRSYANLLATLDSHTQAIAEGVPQGPALAPL